ncbi:hypothetical protein [Capnocytophaga leadbetteri]|jgi:hypothetical protein
MKKYIYITSICLLAFWLSSSGGKSREPETQYVEKEGTNIIAISQEVKSTMDEHERQKRMNNKQSANTTSEAVNNKQWEKLKETTTKIQDRLRIVDFALQAIPTGYVVGIKSKEIKENQQRILQELQTTPQALKKVLSNQIQFADDLQMVMRYLTGLVVSYGAINQMERKERQILLNYALDEVNRLANDSFLTLMLIQEYKARLEYRKNMFRYYIERDKSLVEDLMRNIKSLNL